MGRTLIECAEEIDTMGQPKKNAIQIKDNLATDRNQSDDPCITKYRLASVSTVKDVWQEYHYLFYVNNVEQEYLSRLQ